MLGKMYILPAFAVRLPVTLILGLLCILYRKRLFMTLTAVQAVKFSSSLLSTSKVDISTVFLLLLLVTVIILVSAAMLIVFG